MALHICLQNISILANDHYYKYNEIKSHQIRKNDILYNIYKARIPDFKR
jgi:hypothetical protein